MKVHSTNYKNTFITVAEDCPVHKGVEPPLRGQKKSVANLQFDLLKNNPYLFTSDEILFQVYALRQNLSEIELGPERKKFFSKGQACFRASPLTKRYGWGVHHDAKGKIALFGRESEKYENLAQSEVLNVVKAMRSKRK